MVRGMSRGGILMLSRPSIFCACPTVLFTLSTSVLLQTACLVRVANRLELNCPDNEAVPSSFLTTI
ncbi:hypothetical protein BC938DRAFT_475327 [Jimgerdemannia flammicorona]|uniref:Uncharacterized protein n=1 Tax=Jimgerdemannia flammicorona TaxID=994334 RepID=A0A433QRU4_9FUNG|nr:hypothetical protein BC938DRAFT_475327 [Jimgerdemannia flammicorona]